MAAEVNLISTDNFNPQGYKGQDNNLVSSQEINTTFLPESYIELNIYNINNELLINDLSFSQYKIFNDGQSALTNETTKITIDPEDVLINYGFDQGEYITYFNFFNKQIGSEFQNLYISEISSDRTEIRLDSNALTNPDIIEQTLQFIQKRENSEYFLDFYINFGNNQLHIANNIQLDNDNPSNPTILIKLYNPLPSNFLLKDTLWVVTLLEESRAYQVVFEDEIIEVDDNTIEINGPNFNLDIKDQINNSTDLLSYNNLVSTNLTSSFNQIDNLLNRKGININVDYTKFSEFTHFSSAQTRLENFYYKIGLLESYSASISTLDGITSTPNSLTDIKVYENKINDIVKNFDGYDYFLYYENDSSSWPKISTTVPYQLAKRDSTEVSNWFGSINENSPIYGGLILTASLHDKENKDNLKFSIPEYLRDDPDNAQYELFVDMIAQHYDEIWIYHKELTQKYDADNRLKHGISKDIVSDAIQDFGIKLYQNNFSNEDLYTAFLGLTPNGGLFPFPNLTVPSDYPTYGGGGVYGSIFYSLLPQPQVPTGFEYVDTLISASNDIIPLDDVNKSLYKRIYHNIPYLLKSKGTLPGLRALITSYGIPDTVLRINEFGGKDKIDVNDWDHWQNEFNYAFKTDGDNFISSSWFPNDGFSQVKDESPDTVMFRFKTNGLPTSNIPFSQSLWNRNDFSHIVLRYDGTAYISASYSGSTVDPQYQYAHLDFYPTYQNQPTISASISLPFFNGDWWSVMVKRSDVDTSPINFTLTAANKIYSNGENGTSIGFISSSTITPSSDTNWRGLGDVSTFTTSSTINGNLYKPFSGSLQEIRYYAVPINEDVFKDYVMNPHSIEGNTINSSPEQLVFRAPLGGELYKGTTSIHPKVAGSWTPIPSFTTGNSNFHFNTTPTFVPNTEIFFADQPIAGIKNIIGDKIRIENNVTPEGNTLSSYKSLSQMSNISQSYTPGINYLEVAFSPANEINEDIMDQIGYFNMGDYIGDPRQRSSSATSYPDLNNLRDDYFEKYTKNYNLKDFIRLIKFFDNSLFKMIKDFVPARTSLASGIVIKQHLLERNKYPHPQPTFTNLELEGTVKPQWNDYNEGKIVKAVGGTGGVFDPFNYITNTLQSGFETVESLSGSVTTFYDSQDEFYNGEFSGSHIVVSTQNLNAGCDPYKKINPKSIEYSGVRIYSSSQDNFDPFINDNNHPTTGYISIWFQRSDSNALPIGPTGPR